MAIPIDQTKPTFPIYQTAPTSPFLQCIVEAGFTGWHAISSGTPNAFYTLIALGVLTHVQQEYPVSGHLIQWWSETLPTLMQAHRRYPDDSKFSNPGFWAEIGASLMIDLARIFAGKPFVWMIEKGVQLDKTQHEICVKVMGVIRVGLTWYEQTRESNMTNLFMDNQSRNPSVFVNIAQEGNSYYLLYHKDFGTQSKEGFPFFVSQGTENARIPSIGQSRPAQQSAGGQSVEPFINCIQAQTELITRLLTVLEPYFPQQLKPAEVTEQQFIKELKDRVAGLTEQCQVQVSINSNAMNHFLSLPVADQTVLTTVNESHTLLNCEKFPEAGEYVAHEGERMHKSCLANYLRSQSPSVENYTCPRCNGVLNDGILSQVLPDVVKQRAVRKEIFRTNVLEQQKTLDEQRYHTMSPLHMQPAYQANGQMSQPRPGNYEDMGQCMGCNNQFPIRGLVIMNCGKLFCARCLSSSQFKQQGVCPGCGYFLTPYESGMMANVAAKTINQ